ncbi:hypothetical protein J7T55_015068 [Diaporthe amygdali]|uniref:uncharacterized protein n=1 Tax=Phomopsis amygdali TaxID=1214568 RepID=UPI0022FEA06C|nr:uncharacterized protein J7T55_015068 [Diaporthe amygdali]KAJ0108634.1 hypothetical protein J7T55_015068 [Diaporthe amygdali]
MAWNANEVALKLLSPKGDPGGAYVRFLDDIMRQSRGVGVDYDNLMPTAGPVSEQTRLLIAVEKLKENPRKTRSESSQIIQNVLGSNHAGQYISKLMESAAQSIAMIDPTAGDWHAQDFVMGSYRPSSWQRDESFQSFCSRSVPLGSDKAINAAKTALDEKSSMRARKLQKRLGIQFYATDNLAEHLLLENKHGKTRLYIFHYAGYLKARLEQTRSFNLPIDCAMETCLEHGTLPPQLLVETLHSIQAVLFPVTEPEEVRILRTLIRMQHFDPECAENEGYKVYQNVPKDFKYIYWAERLATLHARLKDRPPRSRLEKWLAQENNDGNAFLIALLALFISVIVGILGLILAAVQTWIAWMAWKYPVPDR